MVERVIKFDEIRHRKAVTLFNSLGSSIEEFKEGYSRFVVDTEMPGLTKDLLVSVILNGRTVAETAINRYVSEQKKPLQRYYSEACYVALAKHLDKSINEFGNWHLRFGNESIPIELLQPKNWPLNEELKLVVDKQFEERIRPLFELKISSELDLQLLEKYEALGNSYNELMEFAEKNDVRIPQTFSGLFGINNLMMQVPRVQLHPEVFLPSRTNRELNEMFAIKR